MSDGHDVEVRLFLPELDQSTQTEWSCRLELQLDARTVRTLIGRGTDSLSAVINTIAGFRSAFRGEIQELTLFGVPSAVGFPIIITDEDPDLLALLECVIDAEYRRQVLVRTDERRRKARRRAEDAHRSRRDRRDRKE